MKTMEFFDKNLEFLADENYGMDFYDVAEINRAYKCSGTKPGLKGVQLTNQA